MLFVESLEESLLLDEGLAKSNDSILGKKNGVIMVYNLK